MEYELFCVQDEALAHHGILGMKWGIRRYQNKDGSLTAAGKKRYDAEMAKVKEKTKKLRNEQRVAKKMSKLDEAKQKLADLKKAKKTGKLAEVIEKKKNESDEEKRERILKNPTPKDVYENRHLFSNKEVGELQLRLIQEENIKKLIPEEVDPRKAKADKFIKNVEDLTAKGIALGKAYNLAATVYNAFSPAEARTLSKLDLDSINKGNKDVRKKEKSDAKKEREEANKKAKAEKDAAKKAADDAAAAKKHDDDMRAYEEYNKPWTEGPKTTQSSPYRNQGTGSTENVSGKTRIAGLLGSGNYSTGKTATNTAMSNLPAVVSNAPSSTTNRGQSAVAGLLTSSRGWTTVNGRDTYVLGDDEFHVVK